MKKIKTLCILLVSALVMLSPVGLSASPPGQSAMYEQINPAADLQKSFAQEFIFDANAPIEILYEKACFGINSETDLLNSTSGDYNRESTSGIYSQETIIFEKEANYTIAKLPDHLSNWRIRCSDAKFLEKYNKSHRGKLLIFRRTDTVLREKPAWQDIAINSFNI